MNITLTIIAIITIIIIIVYILNGNCETEYFTNDEAVQNIASLYNQAKFAVTDLTSTGTSTLNTANVNGLLTANNGATINGNSTINSIKTNGIAVNGATSTTTLNVANGATINGSTTINSLTTGYNANIGTDLNVKGNTTLTGSLNPTGGIQAIVLDSAWDQNTFNQKIKSYFNRSMPDGTMRTFVFVFPNKTTVGNVNMRRYEVMKLGNQVILFDGYRDWISPSPWMNGAGDDQYRLNI
jgi:hypothetical protein